ncbi:MAG TPA: NADP-dependent phosphogluconate dehydrogenase, partial [Saprospiraceae bacterium]|nr:NADP-dependent phosphogluconate dehydrogenase [Saprospiraceae bacterium]
ILMVEAGAPIDDLLQSMVPHLESGDLIVDGGNSHYKVTEWRQINLAKTGIHFLGVGISGGEEGALLGPSIMPGGSVYGYQQWEPFLKKIAAKNPKGVPCCTHVGTGSSGHFVKMVHNGIEYAEMQLIAEIYGILRFGMGYEPEKIANIFKDWNSGSLQSYLLQITADILTHTTDGVLTLDTILDVAGSKGTGGWTTEAGIEYGVPIPVISAALNARFMSSLKIERNEASSLYTLSGESSGLQTEKLASAYRLARIINHHQGFHLIHVAANKNDWGIRLSDLASIWTQGCIIRSKLMEDTSEYLIEKTLLFKHPDIISAIHRDLNDMMATVAHAAREIQPIPCLESALTYLKSWFQAESSAHLLQAQRDYFGAHTYKRKDDPEGAPVHTLWK